MTKTYLKWKVIKNSDGERYLSVDVNGHNAQISARDLRRILPKLYSSFAYTERQLRMMEFIQDFRSSHGISPTLEEIAKELSVSKVTIHDHLKHLERKGAIKREMYLARAILPLDPAYL